MYKEPRTLAKNLLDRLVGGRAPTAAVEELAGTLVRAERGETPPNHLIDVRGKKLTVAYTTVDDKPFRHLFNALNPTPQTDSSALALAMMFTHHSTHAALERAIQEAQDNCVLVAETKVPDHVIVLARHNQDAWTAYTGVEPFRELPPPAPAKEEWQK